LWANTPAREAFVGVVTDNLKFASKEFRWYQSQIAQAYFGEEIDLSNESDLQDLPE